MRRGVLCALLLATTSALVTSSMLRADEMATGGARRDRDGRYLNAAGDLPFASSSVTLPFFLRRIGTTLTGRTGYAESVANDGATLRANAQHGVPSVTWIGHATLLVQMEHATFLTDPIWSERASPVSFTGPKRAQAPGVALEDLPPIDFVLISHDHYDHLDVDTLRALAKRRPETRFVAPLGNVPTLRDAGVTNVVELDWNQSVEIAGLRIVCVPAQHWSGRGPFDRRETLWGSYAVLGPEHRFFFAGDTGYHAGFAETGAAYGPFDLAALPIGAYAPAEMMHFWHMNPEEALQAGRDLHARRMVPMHYGTFDLSDEEPDEPPRRFRAAAAAGDMDPASIYVLRIGETRGF
jgi:N-acyl-phosphatidylethanolamine-hydrolysing phospholipase D